MTYILTVYRGAYNSTCEVGYTGFMCSSCDTNASGVFYGK